MSNSDTSLLAKYRRDARADNVDPDRPSLEWLDRYLFLKTQTSLGHARCMASALGNHFLDVGAPALIDHESITALLAPTSPQSEDPLKFEVNPYDDLAGSLRDTVISFANDAHTQDVHTAYGRYASAWEVYARRYGHDLRKPKPRQLAAYLATLATTRRYGTIISITNALSHYFRALGVPDLTKHPATRDMLDSIGRNDQPTKYRALFADALLHIVAQYSEAPRDIRDRNICLLAHLGPFSAREMASINKGSVKCFSDGIEFVVGKRNVFVGGVDEPDLDIRLWMTKWLHITGRGDGALFCKKVKAGWGEAALQAHRISTIVSRSAWRVGLHGGMALSALRKGFVMRAAPKYGVIVVAHQLGYKHATSVGVHSPYAKQVAIQIRKRTRPRGYAL